VKKVATQAEFRAAGYHGRAWVVLTKGKIEPADGQDRYLVGSSNGQDKYEVDCADPRQPRCNCVEFRSNEETHKAALRGERVVDPGLVCKHTLAVQAFRGELDLVATIKAMAEPLRARARAAAKGARMQYH